MESLPPEVRCEIYAHCVNIRAYGMLYVSKQFYNEFSSLLKEDFVLGFHIDPSSSTEVKLISPNNSAWGEQWVLDAASTHTDCSFIHRMPLDRFKGIRILIDPPSLNDPGQVVRGWLQSIKLVTALQFGWKTPGMIPRTEEDVWLPHTRLSNRLPPITIQVQDTKTVRWHTEGSWNRQLPCYTAWDSFTKTAETNENAPSDLEIILTPLVRLRNADAINIELCFDAPVERGFENFRNCLPSLVTQKKSFGLGPYDDDIQNFEDSRYVWLDYLVDDMYGPSAAELRRGRFKFWCSEFERHFGRRIYGVKGRCGNVFGGVRGRMNAILLYLVKRSFHDRFMSFGEHIRAAWRDVLRRDGYWVFHYPDKRIDFEKHSTKVYDSLLQGELGHEETFWEICYPSGIQSKFSNENWECTDNITLSRRVRMKPPNGRGRLVTACQIFPPEVGRCKHCEPEDRADRDLTFAYLRILREFLFKFSLRRLRLLLRPLHDPTWD